MTEGIGLSHVFMSLPSTGLKTGDAKCAVCAKSETPRTAISDVKRLRARRGVAL